jgi:hypothetical protein
MKNIIALDRIIATEMASVEMYKGEVGKCMALKDESGAKKAKKLVKKHQKEIDQLKYYKYYLETNPTEIFLKEELHKLESRISSLKANYKTWAMTAPKDKDPMKDWPGIFNKEVGITKMKKQVTAIKFLLD